MQHERIFAAKTLLLALLESKKQTKKTLPPPTKRSEREDVSPFTLREGLFQEPKTMPGFARARSKSR